MITSTLKNGVKIIKFNNPKRKNALAKDDYKLMIQLLKEAENDDNVKLVALTGEGDFYSSGNDLSSLMSQTTEAGVDMEKLLKESIMDCMHGMTKALYMFPKLLIAVVNGPCIGITATTVALCDVIYASKTAYFYTPFSSLGLCCEGCSSYTFPRILGTSKASEMLLLNHKMNADEALKFNFVSKVYDPSEEAEIWKTIENYGKLPSESIKATKRLVKKFNVDALEQANNEEAKELCDRFLSEEALEAIVQFSMRKNKL